MSGYNVPEAKTVICQSQNAANGAVTAGAPFPLTPTTQTRELPASHVNCAQLDPDLMSVNRISYIIMFIGRVKSELDYDFAPASRSKQSLCHLLYQFGGKQTSNI